MIVWGAICGPIQSKLIIVPPGQQRAIDFIKKVYEPGLLAFMDELVEVGIAENHKGLTLMEDGGPMHTAISSQEWRDQHQIRKLNWPPNSPDPNPIKNLWFKMKHIVTCLFNPKTMDKLTPAINAVWDDLPFDHLESLLQYLPRRMQMVIDQNGAPTCW
ncbi:hypothetical protein O181_088488 [Austropuccinia psidii MF-1]|uniref:Tc1-like transposase DDE domain-containing protein n=1 Tax=Austropuccinia psidii MF-1 TaxID=1389203 RepID=A0A9Q3IRN3_9BASI|nr:hypothetical protein [Austropuccinia psidii MF-1]